MFDISVNDPDLPESFPRDLFMYKDEDTSLINYVYDTLKGKPDSVEPLSLAIVSLLGTSGAALKFMYSAQYVSAEEYVKRLAQVTCKEVILNRSIKGFQESLANKFNYYKSGRPIYPIDSVEYILSLDDQVLTDLELKKVIAFLRMERSFD